MRAIIGTDTQEAARLLSSGELVAIPTETVYGLAGNALNPEAVAKIFAAKQRPSFDPLIVHLADIDRLSTYAKNVVPEAIRLAEHGWPGPLTLVFPRRDIIPDLVTSGLDTVAVRVPRHPLTRALLQRLDFPLAAPSANPFGYISPTSAAHVDRQLGGKIGYILDGGECKIGLESTIVSFAGEGPEILRKGGMELDAIYEILGRRIPVRTHGSSRPDAPGMLAKHYSPKIPFVLSEQQKSLSSRGRIARIVFGPEHSTFDQGDIFNLSEKGDMGEAARQLFGLMRRLDEGPYDLILADLLPEEGLGVAINDRLRRAAAR